MKIIKLGNELNKTKFNCGNNELNIYLKQYALQNQKKNISNCFCLIDQNNNIIAYYTLSSASMPLAQFPNDITRKLPKYDNLGCAIIGRLAIDINHQSKGIGSMMIIDAMKRCFSSDISIFSIIVDAKDENAANFYKKLGFTCFADYEKKLFITRPSDWK